MSALPAEWRQFIGKYDSSAKHDGLKSNLAENHQQAMLEILELKREREKVWEEQGCLAR